MKTVSPVTFAVALAWCMVSGVHAGDCSKPGLDEDRDFSDEGVNYQIDYRVDAASSHRIAHADAADLEDMARSSWDRLVDVMGFRTPYLNSLPIYNIIVKDDWYYAEPGCLAMHAVGIRANDEPDTRVIFLHERFHTVQRNYKCDVNDCNSGYIGSTFGKWASEGAADAVMDKGYADIDDSTGGPYYEGSARNYLNAPDLSLFDREYNACLWWNYLMEQLGFIQVEPHYGIDFMEAFWDRVAANGTSGTASSQQALRQTISAFDNRSLESLFVDMSVCNYTRDYDVAGIPNDARYYYVDEQTQRILTNVPVTAVPALPRIGSNVVINAFSADYYEYEFTDANECEAVGFQARSNADMGFAVVAVDGGGKVIGLRSGIGRDFAASFLNPPTRPIQRICGIAVGLNSDTEYNFTMDRGNPKLSIVRPNASHPAYPGPHDDAGNIVVRTLITGVPGLEPEGPGNLSILGLLAEDFSVRIGGLDALVVYANYVGGEYQLLVNAPDQPADGFYDLEVSLCREGDFGGYSARSVQSVYYGEIFFHHVVSLDVSGSMEYPTTAKLDAAKEAAKFYIDAVNDRDKLTLVTFSGDQAECNEDAINLKGAPGLLDANDSSRAVLKAAVDLQTKKNMTSIGDGLWTAQDALDAEPLNSAGGPLHIDSILLLSDGQENEARYWKRTNCIGTTTVADRISAEDTTVNAIAFGEDADFALMQDIKFLTDGDYSYVPVDDGTGAAAGAPAMVAAATAATGLVALQNKLTVKFLQGLERARSLQRLAFETSGVGGETRASFFLPLGEDKVAPGLIYVGWSRPGKVKVTVLDPNGQDVADYCKVYTGESHFVFHPQQPLDRGEYEVVLDNSESFALECFAGISGIPGNGLTLDFTLAPVRTGPTTGRTEPFERYAQGLPVDMLCRVYDRNGPVLNVKLADLQVIMPGGESACDGLRLYDDGAHVDQGPGDGLYGLRYTRTPFAALPSTGQKLEIPSIPGSGKDTGTYRVRLRIQGTANNGARFDRVLEREFQVYRRLEQPDTDEDGMPDTWEKYYGTKVGTKDNLVDADHDGLNHFDEFMRGTHPFDPDTDGGGEADGSEVKAGRCPLAPEDDLFPPLTEVHLITTSDSHGSSANLLPNALLIHFPDDASYEEVEVFRSTLPGNVTDSANRVKSIDVRGKNITGYYDEGLVDGQAYHYALRAVGAGGARTPFSRILHGVAKAHPWAPEGQIVINGHAPYTDSLKVMVRLLQDGEATEYRLSQQPFTGVEPFLPLVNQVTVTLAGLVSGDIGVLYAQFRNPEGNVSRTVDDTILYVTDRNADGDTLLDPLDPDDDNDGVSDKDEIFVHGTNPFAKDTDGDGADDKSEIEAGSDPLNRDSVPSDRDGDGAPNDLEALYGTDAGDTADSPLILLDVLPDPPGVSVEVKTVIGALYRVQYRLNLTPASPWINFGLPVVGNGSTKSVHIPLDLDQRYLRVEVMAAP